MVFGPPSRTVRRIGLYMWQSAYASAQVKAHIRQTSGSTVPLRWLKTSSSRGEYVTVMAARVSSHLRARTTASRSGASDRPCSLVSRALHESACSAHGVITTVRDYS